MVKTACQCRTHRRHGFDPLEYEMATHSNILAWKMSWTPQRSLAGYSPWGRKEWATTEQLRARVHTCARIHTHRVVPTFWGKRGSFFFINSNVHGVSLDSYLYLKWHITERKGYNKFSNTSRRNCILFITITSLQTSSTETWLFILRTLYYISS